MTSKSGRFLQLLNYLTRDQSKIENERGESFVLTKFLNGKTNEEMAREFAATEAGRLHRRANNTKMVHELISFSGLDKEKITIEHLQTLTEAYLERRSPMMQAFAIAHFNEDHLHCHIVSSPVELFTGRSLRMSKADFAAIKQDLQQLQMEKFPELTHSIVEHGRKAKERSVNKKQEQVSTKERDMTVRHPQRISDKARAREAIESCMIMADSKENFYELLEQSGFKPYQRGNTHGITDGNRNYRYTTLINDYTERFNALDEKQERIEELRGIRENNQEREQEYEMQQEYYGNGDNADENLDNDEEDNNDDIYPK